MKRGVLLLNIGTPDSPEPKDVGRYLREFLMDPLVIDLPYALRWFLVNVLIVPRRAYASSEAYQKIWTDRGSPLKFHMHDLSVKLSEAVNMPVRFAMRYQNPSIESVFREWQSFDEILVLPLYPQYSLSATRSSIDECNRVVSKLGVRAKIKFLDPFYRDPAFIESFAELIRPSLEDADHILFSFHGLPSKQIRKMDQTRNYCLARGDCCASINQNNEKFCYRAQSFETARLIAAVLDWPQEKFTVTFQSRLSRGWIQPYTDEVLPLLARHNVKNLVVACPSFTIDCLETIEEIGIRARDQFLQSGGDELRLVSCPNSEPVWVNALSRIIQKL